MKFGLIYEICRPDPDWATEADTYPTGRYNSPGAPTDHQRNSRPVRLGYSRPAVAPAVIGGVVTGDQSPRLGWTDLKHGSYIQGLIDDGMDPDLAYDHGGRVVASVYTIAWRELIELVRRDRERRSREVVLGPGLRDGGPDVLTCVRFARALSVMPPA